MSEYLSLLPSVKNIVVSNKGSKSWYFPIWLSRTKYTCIVLPKFNLYKFSWYWLISFIILNVNWLVMEFTYSDWLVNEYSPLISGKSTTKTISVNKSPILGIVTSNFFPKSLILDNFKV